MLRAHIRLQKKSLDFVWLVTYGHHCTFASVWHICVLARVFNLFSIIFYITFFYFSHSGRLLTLSRLYSFWQITFRTGILKRASRFTWSKIAFHVGVQVPRTSCLFFFMFYESTFTTYEPFLQVSYDFFILVSIQKKPETCPNTLRLMHFDLHTLIPVG